MSLYLKSLWIGAGALCCSAVLAPAAAAQAPLPDAITQTPSAVAPTANPGAASKKPVTSQKPASKKATRKSSKPYSKATISAFAPYTAPAAAAPLATSDVLGAPATLSTVVVAPQGEGLREPLPTPLESDEASSGLNLQMQSQSLLGTDASESKPVTVEEAAAVDQSTTGSALAGDETALGQEEQSVIDRTRDRPKAQPLASGPLRVRVKDSALRATVQIPLESSRN